MRFVKDKYGARWEKTRKDIFMEGLKHYGGEALFWLLFLFFLMLCSM